MLRLGKDHSVISYDTTPLRLAILPPLLYIVKSHFPEFPMPSVKLQNSLEQITVGKILCIGQNYAQHAKEMKSDVPTSPIFFLKPPTAIIRSGGTVVLPSISNDVHHEVELTVLIGEGGKDIPKESSLKHVAGYGIGLDMTMRDIQDQAKKKGMPWTLAKGFDTSAPLSEFSPASSIPNPNALDVQLTVNGTVRQSSNTRNLIFSVETLIAYISRFITLERGDVIFTGTPEGVSRVTKGDSLEAVLKDNRVLASLSVRVE